MRESRLFLVVAEDPERLSLLAKTLHRKFPNSAVLTCRESEPAVAIARSQHLDAIVASSTSDLDEITLLGSLRAASPAPILLMSIQPHQRRALANGAAHVLDVQQWLLAGTVVGKMIGASAAESGPP
jgi:hypothetical protein